MQEKVPRTVNTPTSMAVKQWGAVHGSKGSIASRVKKQKEKKSYINNSI
jgi:hypothetical protein